MNRKNKYLKKIFVDFILLITSFFIIYFVKKAAITIDVSYSYIVVYLLGWIVSTMVTGKFFEHDERFYSFRIKRFLISAFIHLCIISLFMFFSKKYELSRFLIYGSVSLFVILEIIFLSGKYIQLFKDDLPSPDQQSFGKASIIFFGIDFVLIVMFYMVVYYFKRGNLILTEDYRILLATILFYWFTVGIIIHGFVISAKDNYLMAIWPFVKTNFILVSVIAFFVFGVRFYEYSRAIVFLTLLFITVYEIFSASIYFVFISPKNTDELGGGLVDSFCLLENEIISNCVKNGTCCQVEKIIQTSFETAHRGIFQNKLRKVYLKQFPDVYNFINDNVDLFSIDVIKAEMMSSGNPYNVEILPEQSLQILINLHELNDFRRVNVYLITVNKVMQDGGVFISKFQTKAYRHAHFLKKYPLFLANILYFIDFVWKRVFPKLPFFQKIYFAATKGRNRALSFAEGLGRIVFCGFKIVDMKYIDDWLYFVAIKVGEPSNNLNPSYKPIFKMKRTGQHGKPIYIYKVRTMHPYSEYIQDIATTAFGYGGKDKIKNDFRVTPWGKFLRKYWLDEIPQLYNFIKGDLALVGVRPVSDTFLSTYPKDQMQERFKYKPGCIPPYVAYKMQSREKYIESEKRYFMEKQKHPVWTDVKVFVLAVYNILTKKISSE